VTAPIPAACQQKKGRETSLQKEMKSLGKSRLEESSFHDADAVPIAVRRASIRKYCNGIPAGVEDTEWEQLAWKCLRKPDGTLDFKYPNGLPGDQRNVYMAKAIEISKKWPQQPLPVMNWKWPLNHAERI
jgi:hypothetical protein